LRLWRPTKERFATRKDFVDFYGDIKYRQLPYLLAFVGQDKDNIPGLCDFVDGSVVKCRFGVKTALKFLMPLFAEKKKLQEMISILCEDSSFRWAEQLERNRAQVITSSKLARLRTNLGMFKGEERKQLSTFLNALPSGQCNRRVARQLKRLLQLKTLPIVSILKRMGVEVV
jgi:5'-3' exonuclease